MSLEQRIVKACDNAIRKLDEKQVILEWLIMGSGIHCLPIKYVEGLTIDRICELYNVEHSYFESKIKQIYE